MLASFNSQGARGFRFLTGWAFMSGSTPDMAEMFVKDGHGTYTYELLDTATTRSALQQQLETQGARGFQWAGFYIVGTSNLTIYRKTGTSTYSYLLKNAAKTSSAFLQEANAQGADGYLNVAPAVIAGMESVAIYEKSSDSNARYSYEFALNPLSDTAFFTELNERGARGYKFRTPYAFDDLSGLLFTADTTQTASFSFFNLEPAIDRASWVNQANGQGTQGHGYVGEYSLPSGQIKTLYFTPSQCSGELCTAVSLFGR